jgi:hypothetical protein
MSSRIIIEDIEGSVHFIRPEHIDGNSHFGEIFGSGGDEALWVVRFCQNVGGWKPFVLDDIQDFYRKTNRATEFKFIQLVQRDGLGLIVFGHDGKYRVTHEFICDCCKTAARRDLLPMYVK